MKVSLILTCAGKGTRAGFDKNKLLVPINGQTVFSRTLSAFNKCGLIDEYVFTASKEDFNEIRKLSGNSGKVVLGGDTRTDSVKNALKEVSGDIVLIHDGARPFVSEKIIKDCIESASKFGSGITALSSRDTILKENGDNAEYIGKSEIRIIQTPQAFKTEEIKKAYLLAGDSTFNDDGEVYNKYINKIRFVEGDEKNVKLTYKEDFELLKSVCDVKVGVGFDCHKLVKNRKLILGGVEIPHDKGLLGHSDADVLTHAVMDAILSALSLRDIGYHFPDKDMKYKDACSMDLLKIVLAMVKEKDYKVKGITAVIMAEKPKLLNHIPNITESLSTALNVDRECVGITATTLEGLGFVGREKGICVHANAVLIKNDHGEKL